MPAASVVLTIRPPRPLFDVKNILSRLAVSFAEQSDRTTLTMT
jgi:hypothetical protein